MQADVVTVRAFLCPPGFTRKDYVSRGTNGRVFLDATSQTVIKIANCYDEQDQIALDVEKTIYERLQAARGHPSILTYSGPYHSGIRLEYASNRNLIAYLREHPEVDNQQRIQWALQITSALEFVHSHSIIHGDLCLNNIFLTSDLVAKLADFGGSSIDGSDLLAYVTQSHQLQGPMPTVQSDLFALGSTLFEIMAGRRPYHDLSDSDIQRLYKNRKFPDTQSFGHMGVVIEKCWHCQYTTATAVIDDIQGKPKLASNASTLNSVSATVPSIVPNWHHLFLLLPLVIGGLTWIISRA